MNVLIVCHAGKGVGLGHLTRSRVVAHSIQHMFHASIYFLIQGEAIKKDYLSGFEYQFLESNKDLSLLIRQKVAALGIKVIVFDLFPQQIPNDFDVLLAELKRNNCKLISIDGLIEYHNKLDLIFIPSFHFSPPPNVKIEIPVLYGWDCYLLDIKKQQTEWQPGKRVLILTGGSDATELGKTLPALLDAALPDFAELHWVTGPYAKAPVWPLIQRLEILNYRAPNGLDDLMLKSNYALTVFGVSFFELLYYGIPTVVFSPYGNKDNEILNLIEAEGVALVARDEVDAVHKLKQLMINQKLSISLSENSRKKMSTNGDQRFVKAVSELMV